MLGPIKKILFDPSVGTYLSNSPTQDELNCMKSFMSDIQRQSVDVRYYKKISDGPYLIYVCGHIIEITITPNGQAKVWSIIPSIFGTL